MKIQKPCLVVANNLRHVPVWRVFVARIISKNQEKTTSTSCSTPIYPSQHQGLTNKTQTAPCSKLHRFQREQPHNLSIATATGDQNHLAFIKIRRAAMGKKTPK
jgi:hypothetical protein